MKKFLSGCLAVAMLLTCADFSFINLTPLIAHAAEAVTDAYDAYEQLGNANYSTLINAVANANGGERDNEQNEEISRYSMIFGQVSGGTPRPAGWGIVNGKPSTDPTYATYAPYNQSGIDGTSQVKSGEWLNDTTYDATAGTPTTENVFVNVGGTQYLVDIAYEYVYRPYIRRYHFKAGAANYRYYKIDEDKQHLGLLNPMTDAYTEPWVWQESVDWEHTLAYPGNDQTAKDRSLFFYGDDDLRQRNGAYIASSVGLHTNGTGSALNQTVTEYPQEESRPGAGQGLMYTWDLTQYPEEAYRIDNWYDCGVHRNPDTTTMSPGMAAAILYKKQIYSAIMELKSQYASIDDNYRADEGEFNIDKEISDNYDWYLPDAVSWMYTYYGMVRKDAGGNGEPGDPAENPSIETQKVEGSDTYKSTNVFDPVIISYIFDWDGYSQAGADLTGLVDIVDSDRVQFKYNSEYIQPVVLSIGLNCVIDDYVTGGRSRESSYWKQPQIPSVVRLRLQDTVCFNAACTATGSYMFPFDRVDELGWNNFFGLYLDAWDNLDKYGTSISVPISDFTKCWSIYWNDVTSAYDLWGLQDHLQSGLGSDQFGGQILDSTWVTVSDGVSYSTFAELYYTAMNDLFTSVSGLFYTDEITELFGDYGFPGYKFSNITDEAYVNKCVAQNLYNLFGVPIGPQETITYEHSWSVPWACFPSGGDMDGIMEDAQDVNSIDSIDLALLLSSFGSQAVDLTVNEFFGLPVLAPQYMKYTRFDFKVEIESTKNPYRSNPGYEYYISWHEKNSTHDTHGGFEHSDSDNVCAEAEKANPPSGYGGHGCSWCGDCGKYTTGCTDEDCDDDDCTSCPHHSAGTECTLACEKHWHSADSVHNTRATAKTHDTRTYREQIVVHGDTKCHIFMGNENSEANQGNSRTWTEETKYMNYDETIAQTFKNVRYLNLISYSIYTYDRAEVRGLGSLLAQPVNITNADSATEELIVTEALSSMGYSAYDIDETGISNNVGAQGIRGATDYWNNLQIKGRVANSFNPYSKSNNYNNRNLLITYTYASTESDTVKKTVVNTAHWLHNDDVPILRYNSSTDSGSAYEEWEHEQDSMLPSNSDTGIILPYRGYRNFVNGDRAAFMLVESRALGPSDDLYFVYNPYSQGGRSHTTFGGFIAQALAHTFYQFDYEDDATGGLLSYRFSASGYLGKKLPYSNSLRIQGDYLAIRDIDGKSNTVVGSMYDTWDETADEAYLDGASKFNILNIHRGGMDVTAPLSQYMNGDCWIPGSLSYILSRVPYHANDVGIGLIWRHSTVNCLTDCWMIHTFVGTINDAQKNAVDSYNDSAGVHFTWSSDDTSSIEPGLGMYPKYNPQGGINPYMTSLASYPENRWAVWYVENALVNNKGESVMLKDSLNEEAEPKFQLPDAEGTWSTSVTLTYAHEGNNAGQNFANWKNQRTSNLVTNETGDIAYVGYQSEGIGVQNIVRTGNGTTTQTGYTDSDLGKAFNADKTMVTAGSGQSPYGSGTYRDKGGFARFGISTTPASSVYSQARDIQWNEEINTGNVHPKDTDEEFSRWYPWLSDGNLNRYLPNGRYFSGQIYNVYTEALRHADGGVGGTYDYNRVPNGVDEVRVNTHYTRSRSTIGGTDSDTLPNSLVVYNPATTFTAHLVAPGEYMPDATNYGIADDGSRRYLAGYGELFGKLVLRDQRISRHTTYGSQGTEDYTTDDGIITVTGQNSSTSYHYEMRYHDASTQNFMYYESMIETKAYTMEDYEITTSSGEVIDLDTTSEGRYHTFNESTTLKIVTKDSHGSFHAATVDVSPWDTITWEDSAVVLTRGSDNFELNYQAFQDAFAEMQRNEGVAEEDLTNTIDFIPMTRGTVMNPVNGVFDMKKGSTITFTLPITDANGSAIEDPFQMELPEGFNWQHTTNGIYHTYYIEATDDLMLSGIELKSLRDYRIQSFDGSAISAHKILLMSIGIGDGLNQVPVENVTTLNYYYSNSNYSVNTTNRWGSYNTSVVDIAYTYDFVGVDVSWQVNHCYMQGLANAVSVYLDQSDPHKVPNTNWRYYVLGWKTEYGDYITSVYDPALAEGSTVRLIPPIGATADNYLDAVTLDNMAQNNKLGVARYGNNFYLTELAGNVGGDQYDYTLEWYGLTVTEFDTISFGEETTKTYGTLVSWEQTTETMKTQVYLKSYELVFRCSWGTITRTTEISIGMYAGCNREVRAYDVRYSGNIEHKLAMDIDVGLQDWIRVADIVNDTVIDNLQTTSGDYVSLDDEFTLYWDNMVDLTDVNRTSEQRALSTTLGRGWDVNTDDSEDISYNFNSLKNAPSGLFAGIWTGGMTDANGLSKYTDTTKWIYSKYVTFNVDMYGFTEGSAYTLKPSYDPKNPGAGDTASESIRQFDPTTPAYNAATGQYNNLVYIPAGTPVHLGYYKGDSTADNSGEFVDYGYNVNGTTKDPNGDNYVYHFWCPLSVGESDSQVVAEYHVTTINNGDTGSGNQTAWNWGTVSRYRRGAEKFAGLDTTLDDEWGNDILKVGSTFNKDNLQRIDSLQLVNNGTPDIAVSVLRTAGVYTRPGNSYNTTIMSVAGRVGALTVVDSGDPRYQDSFKNPTSAGDYAITPIVLAVRKYTNDETPTNAPGSQHRYLTDASDVRGRLGRTPSISVMYNLRIPFNTYGTQWFKEAAERFWLPMGKDFNIHLDSNLPEQRLGYELYCSLETIGNYYGSSMWRLDSGETPSNLNDDYGQTKIQIRPYYVYLDTTTGRAEALDVYMRRNGNYVLLNAGSKYSSAAEDAANGNTDGGPYWIDASHSAYYTMSIKSNTEVEWKDTVNETYRLDQTLLRRMVTKREAETTYYVMYTDRLQTNNQAVKQGITETLLEPFELDSSAEEDLLDYNYYYGNTQIEFLREQNRTFIGGVNDYIEDSKETNWTDRAKRYAQKWHFGLGLPSSAVFVKHGAHEFNDSTIINGKDGVILVMIDVYAVGEKWVLHYQSELSNEGILVDGHEYSADDWKVYPDQVPNMIPVSMYRADQLAPNDIEDRGTY